MVRTLHYQSIFSYVREKESCCSEKCVLTFDAIEEQYPVEDSLPLSFLYYLSRKGTSYLAAWLMKILRSIEERETNSYVHTMFFLV